MNHCTAALYHAIKKYTEEVFTGLELRKTVSGFAVMMINNDTFIYLQDLFIRLNYLSFVAMLVQCIPFVQNIIVI